ncbi:MAG: hypothetical protein PUI37_04770, partial [Oscillospiraceae bacterium]|nr:hypothetical protein [Oscillospiraceae bacterium]
FNDPTGFFWNDYSTDTCWGFGKIFDFMMILAIFILELYMPAGESTLHGVLVHGFRSCSALFPVC